MFHAVNAVIKRMAWSF